jgi:hypothetical protein
MNSTAETASMGHSLTFDRAAYRLTAAGGQLVGNRFEVTMEQQSSRVPPAKKTRSLSVVYPDYAKISQKAEGRPKLPTLTCV